MTLVCTKNPFQANLLDDLQPSLYDIFYMKKNISITLGVLFLAFANFSFGEKYQTLDHPKDNEKYQKIFGVTPYIASGANAYPIPHVLDSLDGKGKIATAQEWNNHARNNILKFYEDHVYGKIAPRPESLKFELFESSDNALEGTALRRQYKIISTDKFGSHEFIVLVYLPKNVEGKVPAFVYQNFWGNYSLTDEKQIPLPKFRYSGTQKIPVKENARGSRDRLPVRDIIARGYAVATFCYCDVYPDLIKKDGAPESIYKIFHKEPKYPECMPFPAWAWGNMRVMDLLESIPEVDSKKVAVVGHSRLGKTSLITGAYDKRFAYVIVNNSGCLGDALSKRKYGESIHIMGNLIFHYWLMPDMKKYANNEGELPLDQHHLLATIAPRMLYTAAATEDVWADPEGQLLGLIHSTPAFALFGAKNFPTLDALEIEKPFHGDVAFHIRRGKHNITPYDWKNFMDYAQKCGWEPKKTK